MSSHITTKLRQSGQDLELVFLGFSGGERHVQIESLPDELIESVNIQAKIHSSNDLMDYLLLENALFQHNPNIHINLEIPYLPYARQDRVCAIGQAFSMQLMADLLNMRPKQMTVWDCHSTVGSQLAGAVNIEPWQIISANSNLVDELQDDNAVLVCPDKGAKPRSEAIVQAFNLPNMVYCEKKRDPMSGKILATEVSAHDLSGKTAIITDDICDGGMTFIGIAQALRALNCSRIVLYITHGIFSKGLSVFDGLIDHIYTTDSFTQSNNPQLTIINFKTQEQ